MSKKTNEAQTTTINPTLNPNTHTQSKENAMSSIIAINKPEAAESQAIDEMFVQQAKALSDEEIVPCRADPYAAVANVESGLRNIENPATLERIRKALPETDVTSLLELPKLGQAVLNATEMIVPVEKDETLPELVARGTVLRKAVREQVQLLVTLGHVAEREIAQLKDGRSPADLGQHLKVAAGILNRTSEKVPLTLPKAMVDEALSLGVALWDAARRAAARGEAVSARAETLDLRERLWTLFVRRHEELRRVARYLWEDEADAFVPPMKKGKKGPRKAKAATPSEGKEGKENSTVTEQPVSE